MSNVHTRWPVHFTENTAPGPLLSQGTRFRRVCCDLLPHFGGQVWDALPLRRRPREGLELNPGHPGGSCGGGRPPKQDGDAWGPHGHREEPLPARPGKAEGADMGSLMGGQGLIIPSVHTNVERLLCAADP